MKTITLENLQHNHIETMLTEGLKDTGVPVFPGLWSA